jgi:hypothetical protein
MQSQTLLQAKEATQQKKYNQHSFEELKVPSFIPDIQY